MTGNRAASIRARLKQRADKTKEDFRSCELRIAETSGSRFVVGAVQFARRWIR